MPVVGASFEADQPIWNVQSGYYSFDIFDRSIYQDRPNVAPVVNCDNSDSTDQAPRAIPSTFLPCKNILHPISPQIPVAKKITLSSHDVAMMIRISKPKEAEEIQSRAAVEKDLDTDVSADSDSSSYDGKTDRMKGHYEPGGELPGKVTGARRRRRRRWRKKKIPKPKM